MPDDDAGRTPRDRAEEQRILSEARIRQAVVPILHEERLTFYDRVGISLRTDAEVAAFRMALHALETAGFDVFTKEGVEALKQRLAFPVVAGFDVSTPEKIAETKRATAFLYRSSERAATLGKRTMKWLTGAFATLVAASELVSHFKEIREWFK